MHQLAMCIRVISFEKSIQMDGLSLQGKNIHVGSVIDILLCRKRDKLNSIEGFLLYNRLFNDNMTAARDSSDKKYFERYHSPGTNSRYGRIGDEPALFEILWCIESMDQGFPRCFQLYSISGSAWAKYFIGFWADDT